MNTVELCNLAQNQALESFIEATTTTRFVLLPQDTPCALDVGVDRPSFVSIEVDGEQVFASHLDQATARFLLADVFNHSHSAGKLLSRIRKHTSSRADASQALPNAFTVVIREGDANGAVAGTYDFSLLNQSEYCNHLHASLHERDERPEATAFTTDARPIASAHNCWHCGTAVNCKECQNCGCHQS